MYRLCVIFVGLVVGGGLVGRAQVDDADERGFGTRQWRGQAQVASRTVLPGDRLHPARCAGPAAILGGAGLTSILGLLRAEQSHCLNEDGSFDRGRFVFTATDGRTIRGRYYGQIVPAVAPAPEQPPTNGIILGNVCVQGGTAIDQITDDCAAGRYAAARGVLNLTTGDGTIFLDYTLRLRP